MNRRKIARIIIKNYIGLLRQTDKPRETFEKNIELDIFEHPGSLAS